MPTGRVVLAALAFATVYAVLAPCLFLLATLLLAWETVHWLLASVLLVPVLTALGLFGLLAGLPAIALLVGAVAARTAPRRWPALLTALVLPLVDLLLRRQYGVAHLTERLLLALMDHRALFVLGTVAPVAASMAAVLLIPRRLVMRLLGPGERRDQDRAVPVRPQQIR